MSRVISLVTAMTVTRARCSRCGEKLVTRPMWEEPDKAIVTNERGQTYCPDGFEHRVIGLILTESRGDVRNPD